MAPSPTQIGTYGWTPDSGEFSTLTLATYGWLSGLSIPDIVNTDFCNQAKDLLIEEFKNKENINNYLCVLIKPLQELEFIFGDLFILRRIVSATGAQLDGLGDIVGAERNGLTDEQYRSRILFQAAINMSNGEPETMISIVRTITQATDVKYFPAYPAGFLIFSNGPFIPIDFIKQLEMAAPSGVQVEFTTTYGETTPFAVAPDPGDTDPDAAGFSEPGESGSGGVLTEKFS